MPLLMNNIRAVGFNPSDIKYVINTHGHFDHAGGSAYLQKVHGAEIVMTAEDWAIARAEPELPQFYMPQPNVDIVAKDGDTITLGDNTFELFNTPGHTTGVLSIRYKVREGDNEYTAMTLGGVGLNFSGVARTETYIQELRAPAIYSERHFREPAKSPRDGQSVCTSGLSGRSANWGGKSIR